MKTKPTASVNVERERVNLFIPKKNFGTGNLSPYQPSNFNYYSGVPP
jgi:hypothetical protein